MEEHIRPDGPIEFVGPFNPATFNFGGYRRGVKPEDIEGFDTPIYDATKLTSEEK